MAERGLAVAWGWSGTGRAEYQIRGVAPTNTSSFRLRMSHPFTSIPMRKFSPHRRVRGLVALIVGVLLWYASRDPLPPRSASPPASGADSTTPSHWRSRSAWRRVPAGPSRRRFPRHRRESRPPARRQGPPRPDPEGFGDARRDRGDRTAVPRTAPLHRAQGQGDRVAQGSGGAPARRWG